VAVLNLENYTVSSTIEVVEGPEKMVVKDQNLFVAHIGGFGFGNSIVDPIFQFHSMGK
jgi:hypothetical protein